jgi:hypothetical protein
MLMQLVCVDRRYQRMNCFNIRELQGILKRRFFTDVINSADHRTMLSSSMIGLRFMENNNLNLDPDVLSFHKLGTSTSPKFRLSGLRSTYESPNIKNSGSLSNSASYSSKAFSHDTILLSFIGFLRLPLDLTLSIFKASPFHSIQSSYPLAFYTSLLSIASFNFRPVLPSNSNWVGLTTKSDVFAASNQAKTIVFLGRDDHLNSSSSNLYTSSENENLMRFSRFTNPILSYDYKCGHYIGIWDKLFPSLMTSFIEVARGIKKAPWFTSEQYSELLLANYKSYFSRFTDHINLKLQDADN